MGIKYLKYKKKYLDLDGGTSGKCKKSHTNNIKIRYNEVDYDIQYDNSVKTISDLQKIFNSLNPSLDINWCFYTLAIFDVNNSPKNYRQSNEADLVENYKEMHLIIIDSTKLP
jgi:hypothetical protein